MEDRAFLEKEESRTGAWRKGRVEENAHAVQDVRATANAMVFRPADTIMALVGLDLLDLCSDPVVREEEEEEREREKIRSYATEQQAAAGSSLTAESQDLGRVA